MWVSSDFREVASISESILKLPLMKRVSLYHFNNNNDIWLMFQLFKAFCCIHVFDPHSHPLTEQTLLSAVSRWEYWRPKTLGGLYKLVQLARGWAEVSSHSKTIQALYSGHVKPTLSLSLWLLIGTWREKPWLWAGEGKILLIHAERTYYPENWPG